MMPLPPGHSSDRAATLMTTPRPSPNPCAQSGAGLALLPRYALLYLDQAEAAGLPHGLSSRSCARPGHRDDGVDARDVHAHAPAVTGQS
jgi:hypothetical protein